MKKLLLVAFAGILVLAESAIGAQANGRVQLPMEHAYQQQLRKFMSTLKTADFQPAHQYLKVVPWAGDPDEKLRMWVLSFQPPSVGRKRNYSSVMLNAAYFTLDTIEGAKAIMRPPAHPEPLVDLANLKYPGNPYFNSRHLRMRAFVLAALDMVMLDKLLEGTDEKAKPVQPELLGGIGRFAYVYPGFQELLPAEVREAYLAGLKKLVRRALDNGPKQLPRPQGMYTWAAPALFLAAKVLNNPEITKEVDAYAKAVFTEERFFRVAGYFPAAGTLDSFNGISTYYAVWGALASDWPFARDAIAKVYRLRSHLTLPEPDGILVAPSHMASLTSAEMTHEQWNWPMRTWGAALVADEAACLTKMPTEAELQNIPTLVVGEINAQLQERATIPGRIDPEPWKLEAVGTVVNFAYQYYPKGYHARRMALEKQLDPVLLPVLREGSFVRTFPDEFLVAKTPSHAAIIHTGPIADPGNTHPVYGLGGGALSAFWTPATGSVILGRGIGVYSPQYKKELEEWRSLPSHAVTGITADGKVFTSAHIVKPDTLMENDGKTYTVIAKGLVPSFRHNAEKPLAGKIEYERKFESTAAGVRITTTLKGDGKDSIAELYEVLPLFLNEARSQPKVTATIEFQADGKWLPAADAFKDKVTAVRIARFTGAVTITFDKPCRVKMAPPWADTYQTGATCRNLLIDLLDNGGKPGVVKAAKVVSYRIEGVGK